ncbi:hypothetical protein NC661_04760 [Aquibacillus koreensis]|uniref:Uncharacterized protein n=1 Tax=Aquibacillus koreensis TaxID=279446 RepID=A0A9X3WJX2_9BACI|nr:hypothetical protein [Aquibacillus koreensis]MCT2534714.1 hypothetical protein [Aquibacillus koreensis]MDC3419676.1 hypothetical protein [Aquibacillus koreensis]
MSKAKPIYIILFILLTITMWIVVFPISIEKALEKQGWNKAFLTVELESDSVLLFMEEEKGKIRLASAYRGLFGWKIADNTGLLSVNSDVEGFSGSEGSILIKNDNKLHYLFGIIVDEDIDSMTYKTNKITKEKMINTFTTQNGTRIYYSTHEQEFGDVTYIAYNHQNELVYSKP